MLRATRRRLVGLAVAVLAVGGLVAPALAVQGPVTGTHGYHLGADSQVTSDGTVVLETLFVLRPSYVVLRADDGGQPGEPLGHVAFDRTGFRTDIPVSVDPAVWKSWNGNRTVWAVLHRDDGDGEFDVDEDTALTARNTGASTRFTVRKRAGERAGTDDDAGSTDTGDAVRVLAAAFDPQRTAGSTVTVRRVDLAEPGYVAVETRLGTHLGSRRLGAGTHRNVTVAVNASRFPDRSRFQVRAVAHRDDGDGGFDAGDPRVRAGGDPVATTFSVEHASGTDTGTDEPLIVTPAGTPSPTASPSPGSPPGQATPTPSSRTDGPPLGSPSRSTGTASPGGTTRSSGSGPGFGVLGAAGAAFVLAALVAVGAYRRE